MKIAVLLSGGVDSSVALSLLKNEGHEITAFYLKIWLQDDFTFLGDCPWEDDLNFVRGVCKQLNIPLEIISLQHEYWENVVTYAIGEIKEGRTPNPDIFCNSLIKFGQFYDKIDNSFEKVASGHYADVGFFDGHFILKKSPDPVKDQTYFLAYLTQKQLSRALFPIGLYRKVEIRNLAHEFSLPNMDRKDSQGICFLGKIKFNDFVKHHLGEMNGDILEFESGKKLGIHNGYYFYTIGQRSGIRLSGGPWYVVKKDIVNNNIYISRENIANRAKDCFISGKFNWISGSPPKEDNLQVKIRHGAAVFNCKMNFLEVNKAEIKMDRSDQGIASGQFAVFYQKDICLGAGVIL
jgi:tRNA-specific 2-thiouridylase